MNTKKAYILFFFAIAISTATCTSSKKPRFHLSEEYYTGIVKENLTKRLMEGQKLFKAYCSGCHGIFTKGKDSIPNFSKTEIESYEAKLLYDDEANHGILKKITERDLDNILEFLKFRTDRGTAK